MENKKHFVLIHGACHGAWCWYKLVTLIKQAGHQVTALDLGASGIDSTQLDQITSIYDYIQLLMDFMASLPHGTKVVLVGHSYAGLCISLAMENFPEKISVAVFISAYLPSSNSPPGNLIQQYFGRTSMELVMDCKYEFANGIENPPTSGIFGPEYMNAKLYKYCTQEDLELAKMLIRPSGLFVEDFTNCKLTESKYGSVHKIFIFCEEDEVMMEEFQQFMIKNSSPDEVKVIKEAGHMVMLSRPNELFLCLEEIADKYSP